MNIINIKIKGMMCEGCENRVKNLILKEKNVKEVLADYNTGNVEIKYNGKIDLDEIKSNIRKIDYEIEE